MVFMFGSTLDKVKSEWNEKVHEVFTDVQVCSADDRNVAWRKGLAQPLGQMSCSSVLMKFHQFHHTPNGRCVSMCFLDFTWFADLPYGILLFSHGAVRSGVFTFHCRGNTAISPGTSMTVSLGTTFSKAIQWYSDTMTAIESSEECKECEECPSLHILAEDVNWLTGLNEPPQDVLDLLEFFLSRVTGRLTRLRTSPYRDTQIDDIRTVHMLDHVHVHYMDIMDRYMISWYIIIYQNRWFWYDTSWESWNRWRTWMRPSISSMAVSLDAPRTRSHWAMSDVGNCWEIDARWCCMISDEVRWRLWICYVVTWVYFSICWLKCPTISNVLLESLWKCWCLHRSTANGRMRLTLREFERGLSSMGCRGPQREWSKTPSVMKIVCAEF